MSDFLRFKEETQEATVNWVIFNFEKQFDLSNILKK